jgi:Fasciclin domain
MANRGGKRREVPKTRVITAVWGQWHVGAFLSVALPSLLSPNNLPSFASRLETSYCVYTRPGDSARISAAPIFQALQRIVEVRLVTLEGAHFRGDTLDDHVANHHRIWDQATKEAAADQALAVLIAPDLCLSDGSLAYLASLIEQGKRVIYMKGARVTDETFTAEILSNYTDRSDGSIRISSRQLVALAIVHSHPLFAMNIPGSRHTPWHTEFAIRPVTGEGFWVPILTTDGFVVDTTVPSRSGVPIHARSSLGVVKVCDDSEHFAAVSMTPLTKDPDWWYDAHSFDAFSFAVWWACHDPPDSALLYSMPVRFCATEPTSIRWGKVRQDSDRFVRCARRWANIINISQLMTHQLGAQRSSVIAASLYRSGWLQRQLAVDELLTVLVPADAAYAELPEWFWHQAFSRGANVRYLERAVADYIIRGAVPFEDAADDVLQTVDVKTIGGRPLRFCRNGQEMVIGGLRVLSSWKTPRGLTLYLVDRLFPLPAPDSSP